MPDLTFGEQVKIILSRKGMTIKELAEIIEERTGKKMSRQNLTQRLGRDNFQEQDMRMIASILGCPFQLSILGDEVSVKEAEAIGAAKKMQEASTSSVEDPSQAEEESGRGITVGEFLELQKNADEEDKEMLLKEVLAEMDAIEKEDKERSREEEKSQEYHEPEKKGGWRSHFWFRRKDHSDKPDKNEEVSKTNDSGINDTDDIDSIDAINNTNTGNTGDMEVEAGKTLVKDAVKTFIKEAQEEKKEQEMNLQQTTFQEEDDESEEEDLTLGEVNPYTGREYASNSVRMHPKRIGYVQVYSRKDHKWTDMTEWAFLGYQERKKVLLGKDYDPPIYLD